MLNVRKADLEQVLALLPALQRPTVSSLSDPEWVAVNTILEEKTVRDLIPRLKSAGGQGIVEYPAQQDRRLKEKRTKARRITKTARRTRIGRGLSDHEDCVFVTWMSS